MKSAVGAEQVRELLASCGHADAAGALEKYVAGERLVQDKYGPNARIEMSHWPDNVQARRWVCRVFIEKPEAEA